MPAAECRVRATMLWQRGSKGRLLALQMQGSRQQGNRQHAYHGTQTAKSAGTIVNRSMQRSARRLTCRSRRPAPDRVSSQCSPTAWGLTHIHPAAAAAVTWPAGEAGCLRTACWAQGCLQRPCQLAHPPASSHLLLTGREPCPTAHSQLSCQVAWTAQVEAVQVGTAPAEARTGQAGQGMRVAAVVGRFLGNPGEGGKHPAGVRGRWVWSWGAAGEGRGSVGQERRTPAASCAGPCGRTGALCISCHAG